MKGFSGGIYLISVLSTNNTQIYVLGPLRVYRIKDLRISGYQTPKIWESKNLKAQKLDFLDFYRKNISNFVIFFKL